MAEKESSFGEIKKAVVGVVALGITTSGGLLIANMENIIGGEDPVVQEQKIEQENQSTKDTIIVIQQQKQLNPKEKEQDVVNPAPPEKKEFDW